MKTKQISDFPEFYGALCELHNNLALQSRHVGERYAALKDCKQALDDEGRKQAAAEELHNFSAFEQALGRGGGEVQGWAGWTRWADMGQDDQRWWIRNVESYQEGEWSPLHL